MTLLSSDYDFLKHAMAPLVDDLSGSQILITGGTGVFGSWLLEALITAEQFYDLNLSVTVLTRHPEQFRAKRPHVAASPIVDFVKGDVRTFSALSTRFDYIIHAAAESHNIQGSRLDMVDTIVNGTRRILNFAAEHNPKALLFVSSNAVYGRAPGGSDYIEETCGSGPLATDPNVEYDESKRMAEALCILYFREYDVPVKIARCFPVVGPYLPLDVHFAVGNFIRDALNGGPIVVNGDGTAQRSYLYLADLAIWLSTILVKGSSGSVYNVGSDIAITTGELAQKVASSVSPSPAVEIRGRAIPGAPVSRYVPSTKRANAELGLLATYTVDDALKSTIEYYKTSTPSK